MGGSGRTDRRHSSLPGERLRGLDQRVGSRGGGSGRVRVEPAV